MNAHATLADVDLANCAEEPIHMPGFVQPHGVLLAFDLNGRLLHRSANAAALLPHLPALGEVISEEFWVRNPGLSEVFQGVKEDAASGENVPPFATELRLDGELFDAVVHAFDGRLVIEFERRPLGQDALVSFALLAHRSIGRLKTRKGIDAILAEAVATVRSLTGFDRVMAYRFHPDDSGEIVAEAKIEVLHPFVGMRFPASDIPVQARRLYTINTLRLIADVHDAPVPVEVSGTGLRSLDMSHAVLRSISPIHIEYLKNINVAASMSLSIVIEGRLWGLIACHHGRAHRVPYAIRMACDMLATYVASAIAGALAHEAAVRSSIAARHRSDWVAAAMQSEDLIEGFEPLRAALCKATVSDVLLLSHRGKEAGDASVASGVARSLVQWLNSQQEAVVALSTFTGLPDGLGAALNPMCGMLAICFDRPHQGWIILLRIDQHQTITWSGPPDKVMRTGPLGARLTPAGSLAEWQEVVKDTAKPWDDMDRQLARLMSDELSRATAMRSGEIEAARTQLLAMLGHDLRDPLQTISMVGQIMVRGSDPRLGQRITTSTGRMQRLITQVLDVSRLQGGLGLGLQFAPVDVAQLVRALVDEARFAYPDFHLELIAPDTLLAQCDGDRVAQVFSNLVGNARHHGTAEQAIIVALSSDAMNLMLSVSNAAAPISGAIIRRIFDPFKVRAESNLKNPGGMGLGLYIAKQVARAHGGTLIYGYNEKRARVTFTLRIPLLPPAV